MRGALSGWYIFGDDTDTESMEPSDFNQELRDLIDRAEDSGLHPNHVDNILQSVMEDRDLHANGRDDG